MIVEVISERLSDCIVTFLYRWAEFQAFREIFWGVGKSCCYVGVVGFYSVQKV